MKFSKSITAKRMTTKLPDHINHITISLMTATSQLYWYVPYLSNNFSEIWSFEEFLTWLYFYLPQSLKVLHVMWSILKTWQNIYRILWRLHKHYKVLISKFHVIYQKRVRVFHQGFQTPRNRWKHEAAGRVLLLFRGVWNPWWNTKHEFLV